MKFVESLDIFQTEAKEIPCLTGKGAPTTTTAGAVGVLYMNTDTGDIYKCTAVAGGVCTWKVNSLTESEKAQIVADVLKSEELASMAQAIADLRYVPIDITRITNNVGTAEMGSTVDNVTISWELNKDPESQELDGAAVEAILRTKTLTELSLTWGTTFTLRATDERGAQDTASTTITFLNGVYYGVLEDGATVNSEAILTLTKQLRKDRALTFTADAGATQRLCYAAPARYGTPVINIGGFDYEWEKTTIEFTNASGYTESYDVWQSPQTGLGSTTVKVS